MNESIDEITYIFLGYIIWEVSIRGIMWENREDFEIKMGGRGE